MWAASCKARPAPLTHRDVPRSAKQEVDKDRVEGAVEAEHGGQSGQEGVGQSWRWSGGEVGLEAGPLKGEGIPTLDRGPQFLGQGSRLQVCAGRGAEGDSPCGSCIMATLRPDNRSPRSRVRTGYCGSQARTGRCWSRRARARAREHLGTQGGCRGQGPPGPCQCPGPALSLTAAAGASGGYQAPSRGVPAPPAAPGSAPAAPRSSPASSAPSPALWTRQRPGAPRLAR